MPSGILAKLNFGLRRSIVTSTKPAPFSKSYITSSRAPPRRNLVRRIPMAASGPKAVFGEVYVDDMFAGSVNGVELSKPSGVFFSDRRRPGCLKASVRMVRGSSSCRAFPSCSSSTAGLVWGNFGLDSIRGSRCSVVLGSRRNVHVCSSARDVSVDGNYREEQQMMNENLVSGQTLKLQSGSCYLPHPDKESYGGEDAHFICTDEQAIGVADGVGGWADVGINAGLYARELMSNSVSAIREEPEGLIDPVRVLEKAHAGTQAKGSSTACIIALTSQGIHAINLGDSGFIVIRDGCTIFQSPVQQHGFNFTYQLESGRGGDLPSSGQVFTIPTAVGDVIVAGTDGLFDNLYNNEVTAVVVQAVRAGLEPQKTAQQIAALARERALDRNRQTPFSATAQDAGFRYYGGKLDDITVVVSYITGSGNV